MKNETASLIEYLNTMIGEYTTFKLYGRFLDPREKGIVGAIREVAKENDAILLDYSQDDYMQLRISGIHDHFVRGNYVSILAKSVELRWCFAPKKYIEKTKISTWKFEKLASSIGGDVVRSKKYMSWYHRLAEEEFISDEPSVEIRRYSYPQFI